MLRVENIDVYGFGAAIRGMRNPMNSWHLSDSKNDFFNGCIGCSKQDDICDVCPRFIIGKNDMDLMRRLYTGGTEHRKFLRMIDVSMDIIAPLYWFKEFDTYKVGTTTNSCSTMHKIHSKEFTIDDFSTEHLKDGSVDMLMDLIEWLNFNRELFVNEKNNIWWWQMIQLLPSSYNQRRTVKMNYENVMNILNQRSKHKLDEWRTLCAILRNLPYVSQIRGEI